MAAGSHMWPDQTFKMTRERLYDRGSRVGITSQFLDCTRVGVEAAERQEEQSGGAALHIRAADGQASVME